MSCFNMEKKLLPIKLHYFFFCGALGGVYPFMPVIGKGLGISATAIGVIYTFLPFSNFLCKPFFGYLTDKLRKLKLIIFIIILVTSSSLAALIFLPPLDDTTLDGTATVQFECTYNNELLLYPNQYNESCLRDVMQQITVSEYNSSECGSIKKSLVINRLFTTESEFENPNTPKVNNLTVNSTSILNLNNTINCTCIVKEHYFIQNNLTSCLGQKETSEISIFCTYQFWLFTLFVVLSGSGTSVVHSLSDAACYDMLGDQAEIYGRQRLWGTIGNGLLIFVAGYLNDLSSSTKNKNDYTPGVCLMGILVFVDLLLLFKIRLTKANFSISIRNDVKKIFTSTDTVIFSIAVYIIGALSGLIWNYEFWYLQDLGATQTLLGLAVAIQCLASEVPMFFFAGWFIKTFGYFHCVTGSFIAFALRYLMYYILKNPWFVLPIEISHGVSYAIFYASLTGYATNNSPKGTEATMIGILGGIFEGIGYATGSLLGGFGFDKIGGRNTFLVAGVVSLICVPLLPVSRYLLRRTNSLDDIQDEQNNEYTLEKESLNSTEN